MCAPAALGAAQAGVGIIGAFGQQSAQQAQADAANANAQSAYRQRLAINNATNANRLANYSQQKSQFSEQVYENNMAAQRAYGDQQRKLNEVMNQAAFTDQGMMIQLMQKQGMTSTTGRTGRSYDRTESDLLSQFGRNQSVMAANLLNARQNQVINNESTRDRLRSQNNKAFGRVSIAPQLGIAPPKPINTPGPSGLGLISGIGQAGLSGYSTYRELKAPDVF